MANVSRCLEGFHWFDSTWGFFAYRTQVHELLDPPQVYDDLMNLIVRLGNSGVIHGDFNEFNLMVTDAGKPILIDFPQMMSTSHENAEL